MRLKRIVFVLIFTGIILNMSLPLSAYCERDKDSWEPPVQKFIEHPSIRNQKKDIDSNLFKPNFSFNLEEGVFIKIPEYNTNCVLLKTSSNNKDKFVLPKGQKLLYAFIYDGELYYKYREFNKQDIVVDYMFKVPNYKCMEFKTIVIVESK